MNGSEILIEARPSWWHFFWYLVFCWLIVPLIVALCKKRALVLLVYDDRVLIEKGILSKNYTEIFIKDIRSINIRQNFIQRIVNIGNIMIATSGTMGYELSGYGLPNPKHIKNIIIEQARKTS